MAKNTGRGSTQAANAKVPRAWKERGGSFASLRPGWVERFRRRLRSKRGGYTGSSSAEQVGPPPKVRITVAGAPHITTSRKATGWRSPSAGGYSAEPSDKPKPPPPVGPGAASEPIAYFRGCPCVVRYTNLTG